jgi:hypothetical protein
LVFVRDSFCKLPDRDCYLVIGTRDLEHVRARCRRAQPHNGSVKASP